MLDSAAPGRGAGAGRASDLLSKRIGALIRSGEIACGDRLPPERELMRRFGVSRFVVREAIADLSAKGLLKTRPGYRPVVTKPSIDAALGALEEVVGLTLADVDGVWNLFETRMFVEAALVRRAALHARKDDIQELRAALTRNRDDIGRRGEFERSDAAFHHVLYTMPRNPIYPAIHRAYVAWLHEHWDRIEGTPEIDMVNYAGHEAIFTAIAERDPDRGEDALRRHLTAAWEHVRSTLAFGGPARAAGQAAADGAGRA